MNWKNFLRTRSIRIAVCVVIIAAILLGLCYPGIGLQTTLPESPSDDVGLREIAMLHMGENEGDSEHGEKSDNAGTAPTDLNEREPEETEPDPSEPDETQPGETRPEETKPDTSNTGDGNQGQENGNQGEEGGKASETALAMVMTWYPYGTQPKTIVCNNAGTVSKALNTAQLVNNRLKYDFSLTGEDAGYAQITAVLVKAGDGAFHAVSQSGEIGIELSGASADYTFQVSALYSKRNTKGELIEQEITYTYILHCAYALDAELELNWTRKDGTTGKITCAANQTAAKTVESNELMENVFSYEPQFIGALAESAKIVSASYTTASGSSGALHPDGGTLLFKAADGAEKETYSFLFEVQLTDEDGNLQTVHYRFTIYFVETLDMQLAFTWYVGGVTPVKKTCKPEGSISFAVKNNQLSAGRVKYEITMEGTDAAQARILGITYVSEAADAGSLEKDGALEVRLPDGYSSNTYTITVTVLSGGKQMHFEITLVYSMDVNLQMRYSVEGKERTVACENGKSKTAEVIYDDQLPGGILNYEMAFSGADSANLAITSVSCYQSGNRKILSLERSDEIELLLENGKTGENAFTILAADGNGATYEFKINIPYKHRGERSVKILTNLTDGQTLINETITNLHVNAWTADESGNIISYIPANGTDCGIRVKLDGAEVPYTSSSGTMWEYSLYPANPKVGDANTHTLTIYAEDPYGNFGELTLTLKGQRNESGQKVGKATIYVDMTALGLGVIDSVSYDVLADEPISYSVAKAILGMDTGDPFGSCDNALGWKGKYSGTLDIGFYLQELTPGISGTALYASQWPGSTEGEVLQAIDNAFGKNTGLATLWRCIYRNGLNKSAGRDGTYGDFDFTSGSGWIYSLNGTYSPGQSMSAYYLKDGDVLTLRYTLAYGWDVGSGTRGYGDAVGYCVTALNGSFSIHHQMEYVENADGSISHVCHCCGMVEDCAHENVTYRDLEDGTHVLYCQDCKETIGDPIAHSWTYSEEHHICPDCKAEETHNWKEVGNTATCTEPGVRTVYCTVCGMTKEENTAAKGHTLHNRWNYSGQEHYQKCTTCGAEVNRGQHQYGYDDEWEDFVCSVCKTLHDWDVGCAGTLTIQEATCQKIIYICSGCGLNLIREGTFDEYHTYVDGCCTVCGKPDPNETPPEAEAPVLALPEQLSDEFYRKQQKKQANILFFLRRRYYE